MIIKNKYEDIVTACSRDHFSPRSVFMNAQSHTCKHQNRYDINLDDSYWYM